MSSVAVPAAHAAHDLDSPPRGPWAAIGRLVSGTKSWLLLVLALAVVSGAIFVGSAEGGQTAPDSLPASAESARVDEMLVAFPDSGETPAIAVFSRTDGGSLTQEDLAAALATRERILEVERGVAAEPTPSIPPAGTLTPREAPGAPTDSSAREAAGAPTAPGTGPGGPGGPPPITPAPDGRAAIATVPLSSDLSGLELNAVVGEMRTAAVDGLPAGLTAQITGGPAFAADIANAFDGADITLLAVTAAVVALLLLLTYRSPVLWLVPLIVVALADRTAAIVASQVAAALDLPLDGATGGITSVLVFGAGTNYALLLVSRYREELRHFADHRAALARAVRGAGPAILASNVTVVLALLTLLLASLPNTRLLGFAGSIGLLVALVFGVFVLPPALALCGRRLFWPFIPRYGEADPSASGGWHRVAAFVTRRPVRVLAVTVPVLLLFGAGLTGLKVGLDQTDQFRVKAEAVEGFETLSRHFPAGESTPTTVIARAGATREVQEAITATPGVEQANPTGLSESGHTRWRVVLEAEPATDEAFETVDALRNSVHAVPGAEALVGGADAQALDSSNASRADERLLFPLILGVVLVLLFVLLRAFWAPILLIIATTLSAVAAIGAGGWISTELLGYPAIDTSAPLFAFLFLVALGVDYTIFLVIRAQEETPQHGTREAIVRAVALTGGVITSAGVVLAAVFAVLGVLPLVTLAQLGIIVGLGILLDTFVVRTLVIPAIFTLVGRRVWWPSRLARVEDQQSRVPAGAGEPRGTHEEPARPGVYGAGGASR